MEELIRQALDKYFSDFKEYHLIILIAFTFIIGLIQIIQAVFVSRKIELFKNELKKTEIKFSKYSQIQIEALSEIFESVTKFRQTTIVLDKRLKIASPELTYKLTKNWIEIYNDFVYIFSCKKYLLPAKLKEIYTSILDELYKVGNYINSEKVISSMFCTWENGEVEFVGDDEERQQLMEDVEKYKNEEILKHTIENLNLIRENIENYFDSIN